MKRVVITLLLLAQIFLRVDRVHASNNEVVVTTASWYGYRHANKKTANGERFNPEGLTAAHRTLDLGSKIQVTNLENGKSVIVRVNDRGPYIKGRGIDLSKGAAKKLDMIHAGVTKVQIILVTATPHQPRPMPTPTPPTRAPDANEIYSSR